MPWPRRKNPFSDVVFINVHALALATVGLFVVGTVITSNTPRT